MARLTLRPKAPLSAAGTLSLFYLVPLAAFALFDLPGKIWIIAAFVVLVATIVLVRVLFDYYQWIEVEDGVIRGQRLIWRRLEEWKVSDIVGVNPMAWKDLGLPEKGEDRLAYEVWFPESKRLLLSRYSMAGLDEFMQALADEIASTRSR